MSSLDALYRYVTHHQIVIDTKFRTQSLNDDEKRKCVCPIPTMDDLATLIIEQKGLVHSYQNGEITFTLQDAEFYTDREDEQATHLALLVNIVDKNGSATVIRNVNTQERKEIELKHQAGEGYEVSSHILISLSGRQRSYDMVYMPIPKISTNRMNGFLNRILFEISRKHEDKFTCNTNTNIVSPNTGKPLKVLYKAIFNINGKLDQELFNKINKEGLADVTFIRNEYKTINAPDVNQAIIPRESSLRIMPNHGSNDVIGWIRKVSKFFKNDSNGGYELIKIKFKEPESDGLRTVEMQTANIQLDALERTFIKKSKLEGFSSRLIDSYDIMHDESVFKMMDII